MRGIWRRGVFECESHLVRRPDKVAAGQVSLTRFPDEIVPDALEPQMNSATNRKWWTLGAVCVATFMLLLDITVVNTALPAIQKDLGGSFTDLQWVIDAYALSLAALVLTAGSLADRLGRRRVFVDRPGDLLRSPRCSARLAPDPTFLNLARGLQGVGGAIMFAVSLALVAQEFPSGPERGHGDGHLRGDDRDRRRDRPAGRRPADRRARLAVGLPAQRADRDRRDRRHLLEAGRVPRPRTRPGSTGAACSPSRPRCSCWCWRSCAATTRAGAAP